MLCNFLAPCLCWISLVSIELRGGKGGMVVSMCGFALAPGSCVLHVVPCQQIALLCEGHLLPSAHFMVTSSYPQAWSRCQNRVWMRARCASWVDLATHSPSENTTRCDSRSVGYRCTGVYVWVQMCGCIFMWVDLRVLSPQIPPRSCFCCLQACLHTLYT